MKPNTDKIDDAVLALLHLTSFTEGKGELAFTRVWKGHDWGLEAAEMPLGRQTSHRRSVWSTRKRILAGPGRWSGGASRIECPRNMRLILTSAE
jgi:hypothetical protein